MPPVSTLERLDRVLRAEVDDLGALRPRHRQARRHLIDGEDAPGAEQLGAGDGELTNRPAAEHGDGVAAFDLGEVGRHEAGREDVGEEDGLVVADLVGQLDEADVRIGDARLLRLQAVEAAGVRGSAEERGLGRR